MIPLRPAVIAVMGVSGAGKTTVAARIAEVLGWPFQEGDALHPPANVAKMHAGIPLDDADRWPWLDRIAAWVDARLAAGEPGVFTCSLLKRAYRDRVVAGRPGVRLLYLHGDKALLEDRMEHRHGHFMPAALIDSQFATLQPPTPDERAIEVEVGGTVEQTIAATLAALRRALG